MTVTVPAIPTFDPTASMAIAALFESLSGAPHGIADNNGIAAVVTDPAANADGHKVGAYKVNVAPGCGQFVKSISIASSATSAGNIGYCDGVNSLVTQSYGNPFGDSLPINTVIAGDQGLFFANGITVGYLPSGSTPIPSPIEYIVDGPLVGDSFFVLIVSDLDGDCSEMGSRIWVDAPTISVTFGEDTCNVLSPTSIIIPPDAPLPLAEQIKCSCC